MHLASTPWADLMWLVASGAAFVLQESKLRCRRKSQRSSKFFRQNLRLLSQFASPRPIPCSACFSRIRNETAHLGGQVRLRCVQRFPSRGGKVAFGAAQALIRLPPQ